MLLPLPEVFEWPGVRILCENDVCVSQSAGKQAKRNTITVRILSYSLQASVFLYQMCLHESQNIVP